MNNLARIGLVLTAATLALSACATDTAPSSPSGAPSATGTVTLVTHDSFQLPDEVTAEFTRQTGLAVKTVALGDGGDRGEDRAQGLVRLGRAAGHDRRSLERTLLATGDAGAHEVDAGRRDARLAGDGVMEVGVAAVDDDVARLEPLGQLVDHGIGAGTRLHHDDRGAGLGEAGDEIVDRLAGDEVRLGMVGSHLTRLLRRPVVDGHGVALAGGQVAGQVRAHHRHPHHTDVRLGVVAGHNWFVPSRRGPSPFRSYATPGSSR
ncbi:hypothetical protein GCM10009551_091000 [Nocardiopsis tropica]